jgi:hypothetical protein
MIVQKKREESRFESRQKWPKTWNMVNQEQIFTKNPFSMLSYQQFLDELGAFFFLPGCLSDAQVSLQT